MRKHATQFVALSFLFASFSQAQTVNKGDKLFGGSFTAAFYDANNDGPNYNNNGQVGFFPSFGWAIKNNLVLGIKGGISYSHAESFTNNVDKNVSNSISVGPAAFLKKYRELKNRFGLYFNHEVYVSYSMTKQKINSLPDHTKYDMWGMGYAFNPGVFYKFSENFFGEANIGGVFANYYSNNYTRNFGIGASFLQYFNLGINYRIGARRS